MEESYETFEDELWPPRSEPPPIRPVRQTRRPEMNTTRRIKEEVVPLPQQPKAEPKTLPRELSFPRTTSLQKTLSIQNLTNIETPWENVTLNRCLFVAITILVLTSGIQRLNETLRGQGTAEEEDDVGVTVRSSGTLRHRGQPSEPETSLWEVMFWWLPDLDDDDDDDDEEDNDEGGVKIGKSRKGAIARASGGLRNKPLVDKKLMKRGEGKLKDRRAVKVKDKETKDKKERDKHSEPEEEEPEEDEGEESEAPAPKKNKKSEEKKKKKTQKG